MQGKNWFQRTFSKMSEGGIRGNILLMTMATTGNAFNLLPFYAKEAGLLNIIFLLCFSAFISYIANMF